MRLLRRLEHWLRFRSNEADLADEIAFHREMIERDLVQRGMSPATARVHARRAMGNETFMREEARAVWLSPSLEAIWQDARYTLRGLGRNPVFTLGVTLALALGIGANAAMFSLVDRLMFRPPSRMADPASVHRVHLYKTVDGVERETGGQYARYADLARWTTTAARTAAFRLRPLAVGAGDGTRLRNVAVVSASFFDFFDAPPVIGRYFTSSEDVPPNPAPVAVISHALWRTQFAGSREVIGRTLHIDAVTYTIVGVAPEGFTGLWPYQAPAAFVPVTTFAQSRTGQDWATSYGSAIGLSIIVRRKPGATVTATSADLSQALYRSFQAESDADGRAARLRPRAVAAPILGDRGPAPSSAARVSTWLSGVTLIVLLIAGANVANLMLARSIRRRREIAVRIALGVSRRRLLGQLLTEGLLLALLGWAAGVVIAVWGSGVLTATFLPDADDVARIGDARTLLFTAALALGVGVLTSLAPMAQLGRGNLTADLKAGVREGTSQRSALRAGLLVLQTTLCVVLLVGAGLFVRSLQHAREVPLGFDADSVLVVDLRMRDVRLDTAATVALRLRLLDAAKDVPGVSHATLQQAVPFEGFSSWPIAVPGIDSVRKIGRFDFNAVSAEYFGTMGTRIVRGRGFDSSDRDGSRHVIVVGASMAAALWPGQEPLGQCIRVGIPPESTPCRYVVGVAEDIRSQSIDAESRLFFYYMPAAQWQPAEGGLFVRARDTKALLEPVRRRLQREMPATSFVTVTPLADIVDVTMRSWIIGTKVFSVFGALALVLAALGLYSVVAYDVVQRRHELGVRLALGASRAVIVRLVVTQSLRFALTGVVIGAAAALASGPHIRPMLFRQSPHDPAIFAFVSVVLIGVAIIASWIPALRAARLDPTTALRVD